MFSKRSKKKANALFFTTITCLLSGCATFQSPYPVRMTEVKQSLKSNHANIAESSLISQFDSSGSLYELEQGRLSQLIGKPKISLAEYAKVINTIRANRMKAKIQVSKILENTGSLLTSDRELPYETPDYAMTFLYAYQALNYLSLHDLSNALVSIRQLSQVQSWIQQQHQLAKVTQYKIEREHRDAGINFNNLGYQDSPQIHSMFQQTQSIPNAYENAFSYFLASILYMAYDDYNDAMVSIKDAKRMVPDNPYVEQTYNRIQKGFNREASLPHNSGQLVVIYESGFIESKRAFQLPIPMGRLGLQMISVPYYPSNEANKIYPFHVSIEDIENQNTIIHHQPGALLVNASQMAIKSLTEAYPAIITREILRLVIKATATYALQRESNKRHEFNWGLLVGSLYGLVTAKADQRSWLLLPHDIQLYTHTLKTGKYSVRVNNRDYSIGIQNQKTTLLWIVQTGDFHQKFYFQL